MHSPTKNMLFSIAIGDNDRTQSVKMSMRSGPTSFSIGQE